MNEPLMTPDEKIYRNLVKYCWQMAADLLCETWRQDKSMRLTWGEYSTLGAKKIEEAVTEVSTIIQDRYLDSFNYE